MELRNPHSILAALLARPADVELVRPPSGGGGPAWQDVLRTAREQGVALEPGDPPGRAPDGGGRGGAGFAVVAPRSPVPLDDLIRAQGDGTGRWLALDSLHDPQNVGAIFRLAAFFGVRGVVTARDRSVALDATVTDIASGGVEAVPAAVETNLHRALVRMRDAGLWIVGSSEHAARSVYELDTGRPWVLVLGNEQDGLRRRIAGVCDELVAVRPAPEAQVRSLNVASAAAILLGALGRELSP